MMNSTPTLDRMLEIQEQLQLCGDFLEWLQSKYSMFDNTENLLAEFFDIDLDEAERERQVLLNSL